MFVPDFVAGRVQMRTDVLGTSIRIPMLRYPRTVWGGGVVLAFLLLLGIRAVADILRGDLHSLKSENLPDVLVWLGGLLLVGGAWSWTMWGEELIRIEQGRLSIRRQLWGLGITRRHLIADIRQLHAEADDDHNYNEEAFERDSRPLVRFGGGGVRFAFDWGAEQFGIRLEWGEAAELVRELKARRALPPGAFA